MAKCGQRPKTVADDLRNRQHRHGEDRARNTPHPEPKNERDDDEDGIEGEPSGQKHRRYGLAFDQMQSNVKPRRKQRLPERINGQQGGEKKNQHTQGSAEDRHLVQQKGHRPPEDRLAYPREPHHETHCVRRPARMTLNSCIARRCGITCLAKYLSVRQQCSALCP